MNTHQSLHSNAIFHLFLITRLTQCPKKMLTCSLWFVSPSFSLSHFASPLCIFPHFFSLQIGSCVLFGLYILFKFFSKEYINYLLTAYFLLFGIGLPSSLTFSCKSFVLTLLFLKGTMVMSYSPLVGLFAPSSLKTKEYKFSFSFLTAIPYVTKGKGSKWGWGKGKGFHNFNFEMYRYG